MMGRVLRSAFAVAPAALLLVGCMGGTVTPGQPSPGATVGNQASGSPHLMLTRSGDRRTGTVSTDVLPDATGAKLVYNGGPVLQNVKVFGVWWGSGVQFTSQLPGFYNSVTQSSYYDWLTEYNTSSPAQKIGEGSFIGSYSYTSGATGTIDDTQIQSSLGSLISSGKVPTNDANTLYAIHFAPGINITMQGQGSCQVFCAYHGSFKGPNGQNVYYSVIPDQGGSCAGGCGSDPSLFNNETSVSSHELVEATTDADVGQNNLAWYDNTNGEIGDICNAEQGTICGYTVQKEWSNQSNACIVKKASTDGSCGGTGGGGGGGGGGTGGGGGGGGGGTGPQPKPGEIGSTCADSSQCASGLCAELGKTHFCTAACDPGDSTSCPTGTKCANAGGNNFICEPKNAGNGGGVGTSCAATPGARPNGGEAILALCLGLSVLVLRRRRFRA